MRNWQEFMDTNTLRRKIWAKHFSEKKTEIPEIEPKELVEPKPKAMTLEEFKFLPIEEQGRIVRELFKKDEDAGLKTFEHLSRGRWTRGATLKRKYQKHYQDESGRLIPYD